MVHQPGFVCRCGHSHDGAAHPPFPDPLNCDDAPATTVLPECNPDDACVICLGDLSDAPQDGPLRGSLCARPLARLSDDDGQLVCKHWFHQPCADLLVVKLCPLCRAPFRSVVIQERKVLVSLQRSNSAAQRSAVLCPTARARMARLAGWPLGVVIGTMEFLRRPERAALAAAVPVWQDASQAAVFWEAQELQCFHEKIGPEEDLIGFGVNVEGRGKLTKLVAHFDAVSLTAWKGGLRRAAWKEPMTHWLPLFITRSHAKEAAPLLRDCIAQLAGNDPQYTEDWHSHLPPPLFQSLATAGAPPEAVNAILVLPELMHQLMKGVLDGDRHASLKLLKGYFVLHRLFLHVCDEYPALREAANVALNTFKESPEQRTKTAAPWLAYILQLLTVSDVSWDQVKVAFVEEVLARSVQFTCQSYPNYRPLDPDAVEDEVKVEETTDPFDEMLLSETEHGAEKEPGTEGALRIQSGVWRGRPRGWCCLTGVPRLAGGRHAFSVRVQRLPADAVLRIGWTLENGGDPFNGWSYYSDGGCFGNGSWKAHHGELMLLETNKRFVDGDCWRNWGKHGESFHEGDILTACVDQGVVSFRRNGRNLGTAFRGPPSGEYRPLIAMRRAAEVQVLPSDKVDLADLFASPADLRNMAWSARLNKKGNTLVMFQAFFLSLVRPLGGQGLDELDGVSLNWDHLTQEYDQRFGFPAPEMSARLFDQFAEVHRIVLLHGNQGWPEFFRMLGFGEVSTDAIDRMLFNAFKRATELDYKMGGRHDHA